MATGASNVVRGTRSSVEELLQIYNHSERLDQFCFKEKKPNKEVSCLNDLLNYS